MSHSKIPERWQRIAWAIGAHDLATDMDDSDPEFTAWAEVAHGGTARLALAIAQVINDTAPVHNHGPAEGRGLNCPEPVVNGRLRGACITTSPEPDPWPTEPLIVASVDGGGPQLLSIITRHAAVAMTSAIVRRAEHTLTNVTPVTVVPAAQLPVLWSALDQWVSGTLRGSHEDLKRLVGAVINLREQTDALRLDQ